MGFWFVVGLIWTAVSIANSLIRTRPKQLTPRPSARGEFQYPTAEEGRPVPYAVGSAYVAGPNVMDYGAYSTQAIVEDGATVGYKYFLSVLHSICLGPIDRLLEIKFDEKSIRPPGFTIPAALTMRVTNANGPVSSTITLPAASYANVTEACKAVSATLAAAPGSPPTLGRVVYGYHVVKGWNDRITYRYRTTTSGGWIKVVRDIAPGYYDGPAYALALRFATAGGPAMIWSYDTATFKIKMSIQVARAFSLGTGWVTVLEFELLPAECTCLATMGELETGSALWNASSFPANFVAAKATRAERFFFSLNAAGCQIDWAHAGTLTGTKTLFGMNTGSPAMTASQVADLDRPQGGDAATYVADSVKTTVNINAPALFGGVHQEGGIQGVIEVYHGTDGQGPSGVLTSRWGRTPPSWPGRCYAADGSLFYQGDAPYLKTRAFLIERCPNRLGLEFDRHRISVGAGSIGDDANPACVIHDVFTDSRMLRVAESLIDIPSFIDCGNTLYDEGLGMSLCLDSFTTGKELFDEICDHIDGVLIKDPETGLRSLKLIRADYDASTLTLLDDSNTDGIEVMAPGPDEIKNAVRIKYVDRTDGHTPRIAQEQNDAAIQARGYIDPIELEFRMCTNPITAQAIAARELRAIGPRKHFRIKANRVGWRLRPGAPVKVTCVKANVSGLICRVASITEGEPRDGYLRIVAVEDVYGPTPSAVAPRPSTVWTEPSLS